MITLDDLKAEGLWKFRAHADGSDKSGRFSINFYEAEVAGRKIKGFRQQWRSGGVAAGYVLDGVTVGTLAELVDMLNQPFTAGDDPEARDD